MMQLSPLSTCQLGTLFGASRGPVTLTQPQHLGEPVLCAAVRAPSGRPATVLVEALRLFAPDVLIGGNLVVAGERRVYPLAEYAADATLRQHLHLPVLQSLWRCPGLKSLHNELQNLRLSGHTEVRALPTGLQGDQAWTYFYNAYQCAPQQLWVDYDPTRLDSLEVWPHGHSGLNIDGLHTLSEDAVLQFILSLTPEHLLLNLPSDEYTLPLHALDTYSQRLMGRLLGSVNAVFVEVMQYLEVRERRLTNQPFQTLLPVLHP